MPTFPAFRTEIFECDCHTFEHTMRFAFDPDEDDIRCLEIWVDCAFPRERSFWKRVWLAAKYVFGRNTENCTYGSWIMKRGDRKRFRAFFRDYDLTLYNLEQKNLKKLLEGDNAVINKDGVQ